MINWLPSTWCLLLVLQSLAMGAQGYPDATLEQITYEVKCSLRIERLVGLDEAALEAEYQWATGMAQLCLSHPELLQGRMFDMQAECQRHAGRTSRYRGYGERAIRDYQEAIAYAYQNERLLLPEDFSGEAYELMVLRDIADTYVTMGALDTAECLTNIIIEQVRTHGQDSPVDFQRLVLIAQQDRRWIDALGFQQQVVHEHQYIVAEFLDQYAEFDEVDRKAPWASIVHRPDIQRVLGNDAESAGELTIILREDFAFLARARRLNNQLDEAKAAIEVADDTPWSFRGTYRARPDLWVAREWAHLFLAQGNPAEALGKAELCLGEYVMSPAEEIELLALVSRAKEALGDVDGAMEAMEAAIGIVEDRRANLVTDEYKQSFVAGYAPLYRRALDLVVNYELGITNYERRDGDGDAPVTSHQPPVTSDASRAFQWSERVKGRVMLDTINHYDKRMARAVATSDTNEMLNVRDLSSKIVSIADLRKAEWWPADTALLEFAYGGSEVQSTKHEVRKKKLEVRDPLEPAEEERHPVRGSARAVFDPEAQTRREARGSLGIGADASRFTKDASRVYLWVVMKDGASFHRLAVSGRELDELSSRLTAALQRRDNTWVEPATQLYEHTIRPIADRLKGIKQIVIVGDGKLRTVPFEVFVAKRDAIADRAIPHKLLIEDYAIGYAPSATLLDVISKADRPAAWKQSLWAFASTQFGQATGRVGTAHQSAEVSHDVARAEARGSLAFRDVLRSARSLSLNDLFYTKNEVEQIARFFPKEQAKIWIDQDHMKATLLAAGQNGDLRSVRFLHFATHAIVDENRPYLAGLVLSPPYPTVTPDGGSAEISRSEMNGQADQGMAKSKPVEQVASQKTLDSILKRDRSRWSRPELLTLHELAELDLRSELVVLSACQSIGKRHIEGDWINGLARAFLVAGSSGVLCTLWETGDLLSAAVIPAIYDVMLSDESAPANINVPRALQQYKKSVLDSPRLGHPAEWAAFIYHGRL